MRSPTKQTSDRRADSGVRRTASPAGPADKASGKVPVAKEGAKEGVVTSMVDALEDILKWERASERALRIAAVSPPPPDGTGTTDLDVRSN